MTPNLQLHSAPTDILEDMLQADRQVVELIQSEIERIDAYKNTDTYAVELFVIRNMYSTIYEGVKHELEVRGKQQKEQPIKFNRKPKRALKTKIIEPTAKPEGKSNKK